MTVAAFALDGRLHVAGLLSAQARELPVAGPVFDPRPDPLAQRVAYVSGRLLCVGELTGSWHVLAGDDPDEADTVSWGSADFIAAEEMGRTRGYWWSPDGTAIAACRVDVTDVDTWHIADPANPSVAPNEIRYPASRHHQPRRAPLHRADRRVRTSRDRRGTATRSRTSPTWRGTVTVCYVTVQSRDQRHVMTVQADPTTGATEEVLSDRDDDWVELVPGTPRHDAEGRLVTCGDRDGVRRLLVDDVPVTPPDAAGARRRLRRRHARRHWRTSSTWPTRSTIRLCSTCGDCGLAQEPEALTDEPGVHTRIRRRRHRRRAVGDARRAIRCGRRRSTASRSSRTPHQPSGRPLVPISSPPAIAASPLRCCSPRTAIASAAPRCLCCSTRTVDLMPQRVVASQAAHLTSQWFADQGFVVIVVDGRGTPGRGSQWERDVHGDLATAPLDDQIDGLHGAADWLNDRAAAMSEGSDDEGDTSAITCDLSKVAIRGWSFGGYLAALAVLRRPDVFHAAVAGAPVTEWRLYDTHYTERYLGDPNADPTTYDRSSLLPIAGELTRPLLLIHGLADDNVVAAHTLQLSSALLAAGKPHEVLPLVGVTHMTPQEVVAENLLLHQLDFLRRARHDTLSAPERLPVSRMGFLTPHWHAVRPSTTRSLPAKSRRTAT